MFAPATRPKLLHEELPTEVRDFANITRGDWELRSLTRRIRGKVLLGLITYQGDNLFEIRILLDLRSGGGFVGFIAVLDHNTLIPTFGGNLIQLPTP